MFSFCVDTDTFEVGYSIHGAAFFQHIDGSFFAEGDNMPRSGTAATSDSAVRVSIHGGADVELSSPAG